LGKCGGGKADQQLQRLNKMTWKNHSVKLEKRTKNAFKGKRASVVGMMSLRQQWRFSCIGIDEERSYV
jgi:hypothetical protein